MSAILRGFDRFDGYLDALPLSRVLARNHNPFELQSEPTSPQAAPWRPYTLNPFTYTCMLGHVYFNTCFEYP